MCACPSCSARNTESNRFCSECGAALSPEYEATQVPASTDDASLHSSDYSQHGRFLPGAKVADRYRIVSLVGKGGMGEVYRADDLKLGQTVALKFLPQDLADDPQRLEYFHSEVRLTRQISHPNVCRVYDIGEVDGQQFLSMEYIDGEDLQVLLRRIGRLPHDKGVQISQQLCAGLAAAHDRGVLHRDLKPANIMIDGRGHVRITDFGLARLAGEEADGEIAGTPAYMAPEQLMRGEATIQSDLFALGLILSELFTGQAVLKPGSIPDLIRAHESSLSHTASFPDEIDPTVQRVIRRCLEREPHERPASAHAVGAALPGGDPLAAAMAAGETPSPEMVAASGETGQLSLRTAGICLAVTLAGLACLIPIVGESSPTNGLDKAPAAYAQQASDILTDLGLYDPEEDKAWGFADTEEQEPSRMEFWYRQSPQELVPLADGQNVHRSLRNSLVNPPPLVPGMVSLRLHRDGSLRELLVTSSQQLAGRRRAVSEMELLKLAHLVPEDADSYAEILERVEQTDEKLEPWSPPVFARNLYSYFPRKSSDFLREDIRRVDVAELDGHVVFFHVVDDSAPTPRTVSSVKTKDAKLGAVLMLLVTLAAVVLAWRNVLAGRSDLRGARWLALCMFAVDSTETALNSVQTPGLLMAGQMLALASAARVWIYYIAVEPLARRYWPEMLVTWSRGLAGRVQDPGIGRDILYGMLIGILFTLFAFGLLGLSPVTDPETLCGTRFLFSQLMGGLRYAFSYSLQLAMAMVLVRAVVRNKWLPVIAATLFVVAWHPNEFAPLLNFFDPEKDGPQSTQVATAVGYAAYYFITAVLLARAGVLAAGSFMLCHDFFRDFPWSANLGGPDLTGTIFAVVAIVACAAYGFYTSVGGRAAFDELSVRRPTE